MSNSRGYESAKRLAEKNRDTIVRTIPASLARREEKLLKSVSEGNGTSFERLNTLYVFVDELYSFVGRFSPCKKGCSHCCYIGVSFSLLEAKYIEKFLGIKPTPISQNKGLVGKPCPFLQSDVCSIYSFRPFVCRRHVALFDDPKWCHLDLCNRHEFPQIRSTEVEKSYQFIVNDSGLNSIYDVRQLFGNCYEEA